MFRNVERYAWKITAYSENYTLNLYLFLQILLHKIFHDILVCNSAREATLSYLAAILRTNEKRAQIQVDERSLAGDGFMLNVLSIMQFLAVKVRVSYKYMFNVPWVELDFSRAVLVIITPYPIRKIFNKRKNLQFLFVVGFDKSYTWIQ